MAAPAASALRLRSAQTCEPKCVVVTITGTRPATCASTQSITRSRSVVGQHELLGPVGQDAHALRAGIDHEVGAALLALEVELAVLVEHGGRHGKDAAIDRLLAMATTPPAGRTIRR